MTTPDDGAGITGIAVEGYKSLRARQSIEIRRLTVVAGVNSSGKSSMLQPLLLLKQTLETPYDPGPLRLSGPNVDVTKIGQILSKGAGKSRNARTYRAGVTIGRHETEWTFGKDTNNDLSVQEMSGWFFTDQYAPVTLHERMGEEELREAFGKQLISRNAPEIPGATKTTLAVGRERCLLFPFWRVESESAPNRVIHLRLEEGSLAESSHIHRTIHLPALRGNPRRTYSAVAVEDQFPGTFEAYTAGVIAAWQNRAQEPRMEQLRADLQELGLTWKVEAEQLDDTQVELRVGRLPRGQRGGAKDLVNIADVGFGVSQTLPVVVALLAASPGQLVYLEQPEIHLHPRAQVVFANLLQRAVARGVRVVVETHSALLIRGVQTLVAREQIDPADVALHWFSRNARTGDTEITSGELDRSGAFGEWPEDLDEVFLDAETRYLDAAAAAETP